MADVLLKEQRGRVLILTINNPEKRNAFSPELYKAAGAALSEAAADDSVGTVVITGAEGVFCAGGDVARMYAERDDDPKLRRYVAGA